MRLSNDTVVKACLVFTLIVFAVTSRLLPHPANFAPITAAALFGGAILPRKWALLLPLSAMIVSDIFIGLHPLILFTWGSFAIIAWLSSKFLKNINPLTVVFASIGGSLLFFLVSNFGVWVEGRLYAPTFEGLVDCYYNALPFFRNTLLGDLFYSTVLFGSYAFVYRGVLHGNSELNIQTGEQT